MQLGIGKMRHRALYQRRLVLAENGCLGHREAELGYTHFLQVPSLALPPSLEPVQHLQIKPFDSGHGLLTHRNNYRGSVPLENIKNLISMI